MISAAVSRLGMAADRRYGRGHLRAINKQGREGYALKRVTSYPEIP
jgi:hypothetical protein